MSPFYTQTGDQGQTGLLGEGRVNKFDLRIEALGALDEANAAFGLARASATAPQIGPILLEIQHDLYKLMSEVGATPKNAERFRYADPARVHWIETQIETLTAQIEMPKEFIMPGENPSSAALDLARTIVRRAERRVVELHHAGGLNNLSLLAYLNRLSSLCFALELFEIQQSGRPLRLVEDK